MVIYALKKKHVGLLEKKKKFLGYIPHPSQGPVTGRARARRSGPCVPRGAHPDSLGTPGPRPVKNHQTGAKARGKMQRQRKGRRERGKPSQGGSKPDRRGRPRGLTQGARPRVLKGENGRATGREARERGGPPGGRQRGQRSRGGAKSPVGAGERAGAGTGTRGVRGNPTGPRRMRGTAL